MQRIGRFELAEAGTLFLDEIGEMPLELQPKLLRVLQEQEFERLGSSRTMHANIRLVTATNRDLLAMVQQRQFRDDLYYRLNIFPVTIPPLRERRDDIPLLVQHFTQYYADRMHRRIEHIPADAMDSLVHYDWPGNVRELQNVIERAVILSSHGVLRPPVPQQSIVAQTSQRLEDVMREHILEALRSTNGVLAGPNGAAARLGMKRSTLAHKMERLGISRHVQ
jgi:formate hydrogenlyase transcriptional activator